MFGFLKNKIKSWLGKAKAEAKVEEEKIEEIDVSKKEKVTKAKKKQDLKKLKKGKKEKKEEIKEISIPTKFEIGTLSVQPDTEQIKEIEEELKKKEDFEKSIKVSEEVVEEIKHSGQEEGSVEERFEGEQEKEEKKSWFGKLKDKFKFRITEEYFDNIFSDLEIVLLENNVALEVVEKIREDLKKELIGVQISKEKLEETITQALRISIESLLVTDETDLLEKIKEKREKKAEPFVIVFFGINGSGKTTTIAKLAHFLKKHGLSVILAAGDTFRAASIEQLSIHADALKVPIAKQKYGSDPAAVIFEAVKYAKAHKIDVVLADTAGRMYTKADLMREMEKIIRVNKPDMKIFIAESITGNDAIEQAKTFNEAVGIDGIILSKADIDEKAGTIISVSYVTGKPILYLGVGQEYKDLEKFDKSKVLKGIGLQ